MILYCTTELSRDETPCVYGKNQIGGFYEKEDF